MYQPFNYLTENRWDHSLRYIQYTQNGGNPFDYTFSGGNLTSQLDYENNITWNDSFPKPEWTEIESYFPIALWFLIENNYESFDNYAVPLLIKTHGGLFEASNQLVQTMAGLLEHTHAASSIENDSSFAGPTLKDALDAIDAQVKPEGFYVAGTQVVGPRQATVGLAEGNVPVNAPTNLSVVTTLLGELVEEVNNVNLNYNELATKYNALVFLFNSLVAKLKTHGLIAS